MVFAPTEHLHISSAVVGIRLLSPAALSPTEGQIKTSTTVAAVHNCGQAHALRQVLHHDVAYLIVCHHASTLEVGGQDRLVHAVLLEAVGVLLLSAVAREVEEQHVAGLHSFDEPVERLRDVGAGGHATRVVVREDLHVVRTPAVCLHKQALHVVHVVDAAAQLRLSAEVVDADEHRLSPSGGPRGVAGAALHGASLDHLPERDGAGTLPHRRRLHHGHLRGPPGGGGPPGERRAPLRGQLGDRGPMIPSFSDLILFRLQHLHDICRQAAA
mmetsp:Transcript_86670/g.248649  ORF Transcript_86670/g.248649 Transcript_86670/m.248649 type:complete len:271 (-) Transcript_86670:75-887(-)